MSFKVLFDLMLLFSRGFHMQRKPEKVEGIWYNGPRGKKDNYLYHEIKEKKIESISKSLVATFHNVQKCNYKQVNQICMESNQ